MQGKPSSRTQYTYCEFQERLRSRGPQTTGFWVAVACSPLPSDIMIRNAASSFKYTNPLKSSRHVGVSFLPQSLVKRTVTRTGHSQIGMDAPELHELPHGGACSILKNTKLNLHFGTLEGVPVLRG